MSCDGEPAPDREAPDILFCEMSPGGRPKGERIEPPEGGSMGGLAVGESDDCWAVADCG